MDLLIMLCLAQCLAVGYGSQDNSKLKFKLHGHKESKKNDIPEPPPELVDNGKKYIEVHCSYKADESVIRHPSNCSRSFVCSKGAVKELMPCSKGTVFSIQTGKCAKRGSKQDDCNKLPFNSPPEETRGTRPAMIWHPLHDSSFSPQPTTLQAQDMDMDFDAFTCKAGSKIMSYHPDNCAWYFNCSAHPDAVMQTFYSGFIMECPYPQLFSIKTKQCENFEDVKCGGRYEPKSPCDYRSNHCHETSHCIPCWVRYASCLGFPDGLNPWSELEWKPFFVECYKERTVFQGTCDKNAVFSPLTRACETPYSIPRQHGGWRPVCDGRRDGVYPDEYGRCDIYYVCKNSIFTGFFRCENNKMFHPLFSACELPTKVPYPCGDLEMPNICEALIDGLYLDMFGRCTHYFECKSRELKGISMCPSGVFNPEMQQCDTSRETSKPCGNLTNFCTHKNDGFHTDELDCTQIYLCERGLTMRSFDCWEMLSSKPDCDVNEVCSTPVECRNKVDGYYPDYQQGVSYYYECYKNRIHHHFKCDKDKGGTVFSPVKQKCTYPTDICEEIYGSGTGIWCP